MLLISHLCSECFNFSTNCSQQIYNKRGFGDSFSPKVYQKFHVCRSLCDLLCLVLSLNGRVFFQQNLFLFIFFWETPCSTLFWYEIFWRSRRDIWPLQLFQESYSGKFYLNLYDVIRGFCKLTSTHSECRFYIMTKMFNKTAAWGSDMLLKTQSIDLV